MRLSLVRVAGLLCALCAATAASAQLVPLESGADEPLLPAAIAEADAVASAQWAYLWPGDDGSHIVQLLGDFELVIGSRTLRSCDAVLWLSPRPLQGRRYLHLEVFLWQDAAIFNPGGAGARGPTLFATAATFGTFKLAVDRRAMTSATDTVLFQDALRVREAVHAGTLQGAVPPPISAVDLPIRSSPRTQMTFSPGPRAQMIAGEWVATLNAGVYFARGTPGEQDYIEGTADAAVLFAEAPVGQPDQPAATGESVRLGVEQLKGVYLEGDVVLEQTERSIRAERLYIDLAKSRALILDAVIRVGIPESDMPVYLRAREARQLSQTEIQATDAKVSTSEFYTPHFHIGAERLYVTLDAPGGPFDSPTGTRTGTYHMEGASFNFNGTPVMHLPQSSGDLRESEIGLRGVRVGNSNIYGFTIETKWNLFQAIGQRQPDAVRDADLQFDFYSERGFGLGIDTEYIDDDSFGLLRGYYIYDWENRDDLGPRRPDEDIRHPNRGRATWRHRQYLEDDWQLTVEASYQSDANFLEQYFESEFENDKPQETYFQLKKQVDNWALTILNQVRINNWLTQTESHPDVAFRLTGAQVAGVTLFSENRAGMVRYRPDERRIFISGQNTEDNRVRSGSVVRTDTRQEVELPLQIGPLKVVPFAMGRSSWWDDTPGSGGLGRAYGMVGIRGSMYLMRTDRSVRSELFDVNGLRHVIKLDAVGWLTGSSRKSSELYPFEPGIEDIDEISGATVGIRQRWQTKRGPPGEERVVDFFTLNVEAGFFSNARPEDRTNGYASPTRPEESITSNYVSTSFNWRLGDTTYLLGDTSLDLDDGEMDIANLTLAVERSPRLAYIIGWRMIDDIESNLLGFGFTYKASEKHRFAVRHYSDINRGSTEQFDVTYVRKFPRWYASFTFSLDEIRDNVSISMAMWPEGAESVALGNKRYTGLATSTAIAAQR